MKTLRYDNQEFAKITDQEANEISNHHGMHLNFKNNLFKMSKVEIISDEGNEDLKNWQKTTEELKEIVGEFENQLKKAKKNIPNSPQGRHKAVQDGKLPDCGMSFLRDRGITEYYLKNGWLATWHTEDGLRHWALTQKYISDGVPGKEAAMEELINRRGFAKAQQFEANKELIKII